jgi:cytochrome c oxidase subunit III
LSDYAASNHAAAGHAPSLVREHFRTAEQQRQSETLGMWIFLATEIMFFGALFVAFTVYRLHDPQAFGVGSAGMNILLGSVNTAILITSSFTMALAVHSGEAGDRRLLNVFLTLTMLLGCAFLAIKGVEYYQHYLDHKMPAIWFDYAGPDASKVQMFFVFYFFMTGLHALHMLVGIGVLLAILGRSVAGSFSAEYHTPIAIAGLYWSFVDIIWVFLFAIFYLQGLHT